MRYKIPQFVDMEDKIIGPITMKQLAMLGAGGAIAYASYMKLGASWPFVAVPAVLAAIAFAFLKIQDMSLFRYIMAMTQYFSKPEKRVWIQRVDYVRPPKDLFETKEKEDDSGLIKDKEALHKGIEGYADILDEREESLAFESHKRNHGNEKEYDEKLRKIEVSSPEEIKRRVEEIRRVKKARSMGKSAPIEHSASKF